VIEARAVPEAIVGAAERLGVDLVALGSHERSGVSRAVLGSVADEVARTCSRPVLVVSDRAIQSRTRAERRFPSFFHEVADASP